MRIAIATFDGMPEEFGDDQTLLERLAARGLELTYEPWDSDSADWHAHDLVVARTPWDYANRHAEFVGWVERVGPLLENAAPLVAWNSDKRYLADLAEWGIPVVETRFVGPGEPLPEIDGEIVVKPAVSGGARQTGRFGPGSAAEALELIRAIVADGGTAMLQPYIDTVDSRGETAVVTIDGEVSHVLRKGAVLAPDRVAPIREGDSLAVAEVMYDPDLVRAGEANAAELELAERILGVIAERFGAAPLIARVDMLAASDGSPVLLELEAIEPNLYFPEAPPEAPDRLAAAIERRAWARLSRG